MSARGAVAAAEDGSPVARVRRKSQSKRRKRKKDDSGLATTPRAKKCPRMPPERENKLDYFVKDFEPEDLRCAPCAQLAYPPPPPPQRAIQPVAAAKQSHHAPDYYVRRVQEYRRLLEVEVLRPGLVLDSDGNAALAVESLNRTGPGWRGNVPRLRIHRVRKLWAKPGLKEILQQLKI
ncbi:hypothetical protein AURDEDRAFT_167421, partial [Auricularia subglabra TFB-10046 SS5]